MAVAMMLLKFKSLALASIAETEVGLKLVMLAGIWVDIMDISWLTWEAKLDISGGIEVAVMLMLAAERDAEAEASDPEMDAEASDPEMLAIDIEAADASDPDMLANDIEAAEACEDTEARAADTLAEA